MKDFNEIYEKTCQEVKNKVSQTPKKAFYKTPLFIFFSILSFLVFLLGIFFENHFVFLGYLLFVFIISLVFQSFEKNKEYKDVVITSLVKNYDNNLHYSTIGSISRSTYNNAEFEYYEIYNSEDSIQGMLNGIIPINMSNILTQTKSTDSDGNTTYYTVFSGLFVDVTLNKTLNLNLFVHSDKGFFGKLFKGSDKINMDSQEFEKLFDVRASDKIQAMQLLTSDVMADLIDFKEKSKKRFELTIKGNKLYFRFHCGNIFERAAFKDILDSKTLHNYFSYLDFCCEVSKKIYNLVQESEL